MGRLVFNLFFALLCGSLAASAKTITIHGFVTNVNSQSSFEIDDFRITRDLTLELEIEKDDSGSASALFKPEDIHVGTELEIKGEYNDQTGDLLAKSVKVFLEDTRKIKRTALLARVPTLDKAAAGWSGTLFADGQRVVVDNSAQVMIRRNKGEKKQAKQDKLSVSTEPVALTSLEGLNLDTFVHYEGLRQKDGTVLASKVLFWHSELEPGEARMWRELRPKITCPTLDKG